MRTYHTAKAVYLFVFSVVFLLLPNEEQKTKVLANG